MADGLPRPECRLLRERCREQVRALTRLLNAGAGECWASDAYVLRDLLRSCDRRLRLLDTRYERDRAAMRWLLGYLEEADRILDGTALRRAQWRCLAEILDLLATDAPVPIAAIGEDDDCDRALGEWVPVSLPDSADGR